MTAACPEDPLRPVVEARAAAAWGVALLHGLALAALCSPPGVGVALASVSMAMLWRRGRAAWRRLAFRRRLGGGELPSMHGARAGGDVAALHGHVAVLAGSEATRRAFARALACRFAARGDAVIVLDASADRALEATCRELARALGAVHGFVAFGAGLSEDACRFDAFARWDGTSRIASRLRSLLPEADEGFVDLAARTLSHVAGCLSLVGQRATIAGLRAVLKSRAATEALALEVLDRFFERRGGLGALGRRAPASARDVHTPRGRVDAVSGFADARLAEAVRRLRSLVPAAERPCEIEGLLDALALDRGRGLERVRASVAPLLAWLDHHDLRPWLSPDFDDAGDPRPVLGSRALVDRGRISWFGLGGLGVAGGVVAAVVLAELAELAATVREPAGRRVHVLCNEWGSLLCEPLERIASETREAGLVLHLFGRSVSELALQAGEPRAVLRLLERTRNIVVGATADDATTEVAARRARDAAAGAGVGARPLVSREALATLPELHGVLIVDRVPP
jgi:conjugal transfer pilus assembly protein TraD